jgi:hypothetical protein
MHNRNLRAMWLALAALIVVVPVAVGILHGEPGAESNTAAYPGHAERKKVDPIAANGEIFIDPATKEPWPKPDVALVFSGEQNGYLEPCGCAGLENQKGGLKRRFTFLKQLRDKGWNVVAMDLGGQETRIGPQAIRKVNFSYDALIKMGYAAVGFGPGELKLGTDLETIILNLPDPNPLVSANVALGDFNTPSNMYYKIIDIGGMKLGITSVLGKAEIAGRTNVGDFALLDPWQAIPRILPKMRAEQCDHMILLANAAPNETKELAKRFPEFDWVMTAKGAEEPPKEAGVIPGTNSHLVEVGQKAEYVVVVGLYKNGTPAFRYQRVPLDHRFADAPEIQQMQVAYQKELEQLGLQGLGLKPTPHPSGRKFVGSKTCESCHTKAAEVFTKTPHAHATDTLVHLTPPRHFDPECLSCHVTGWEPQKFFPYESGYLSLEKTPDLVGNGCENCHGPAAKHAAAESGEIEITDAEKIQLRDALHLKVGPDEGNKSGQVFKTDGVVDMCMRCHDLDNSPDFDFQKYWPKVKHVGKD